MLIAADGRLSTHSCRSCRDGNQSFEQCFGEASGVHGLETVRVVPLLSPSGS